MVRLGPTAAMRWSDFLIFWNQLQIRQRSNNYREERHKYVILALFPCSGDFVTRFIRACLELKNCRVHPVILSVSEGSHNRLRSFASLRMTESLKETVPSDTFV